MKVSILTLGCKVNQSESNRMESEILSAGHEVVPLREAPDICIVNTCTVTSKSDYQSRQYIRRALRAGGRVIVTGCYSELNENDILSISRDLMVVPNNKKYHIINKIALDMSEPPSFITHKKSRHFVKIQDGCDNNCTYCAIHRARGRSVSVPSEKIIEEINAAQSSGINEIVLTGIHIGFYGADFDRKMSLNELVKEILKRTSIQRIRLSSLEVTEITDETIELLRDRRLCDHLHVPLQSASDKILRKMGRGYSQTEFEEKIEKVVGNHPRISLGTDVIVGFPGEDRDAYGVTRDFIRRAPFAYLHVFPYSKRKGTPASSYGDQVPSGEKAERVKELKELSDQKKAYYASAFVGEIMDLIIEKENIDFTYSATSGNYLKAIVVSGPLKKGTIVFSRIEKAKEGILYAVPVNSH